jgi:DNA-binding transcriptional LysR family regulator
MELKQVEYFLKVADVGSYSAAAEALYISQSSLSKQIMALEKELDFALFDRSKRKIALTPAGRAFLGHARKLWADYQSMQMDIIQFKNTPTISIVAIPVISQYGITSLFAEFKNAHPDIHVNLEEREASDILPLLNNHQFDLAFLRDNYLDKKRYACLEVARDRFQVVLSRQHRLSGRKTISLAELANENFIMFDKGTVVHELALDACRAAGFEPRIFYASLRVESVLGLVVSQTGVALIMEKVFQYHKHPDVIAIPLQEIVESSIVLACLNDKLLSSPANKFWEFIECDRS